VVVAVVMQQEEDGMTKAEIVKDLVHSWLHHIDHPNPELKPYCSPIYVKEFQTFF